MSEYTEGVSGDGVVFLCDGIALGISEILSLLNDRDRYLAEVIAAREVCSLTRRQDYFNVPLAVLVEAQIEFAKWRALQDVSNAITDLQPYTDGPLKRWREALEVLREP